MLPKKESKRHVPDPYPREFRTERVRLAKGPVPGDLGDRLVRDIPHQTLRNWVTQGRVEHRPREWSDARRTGPPAPARAREPKALRDPQKCHGSLSSRLLCVRETRAVPAATETGDRSRRAAPRGRPRTVPSGSIGAMSTCAVLTSPVSGLRWCQRSGTVRRDRTGWIYLLQVGSFAGPCHPNDDS
jgi:hypothetical protein